jgi:pyruvate,water dikinase
MSLIRRLGEIADTDLPLVGGKAVALAALRRAGFRVPPGLCLTTSAYEHFVDGGGLRAVVHRELGRKDLAEMRWEEIWDAALRIRNRFLRAPMPSAVADELRSLLELELGPGPLAVRSSAPGEDTGVSSFAGLHDSFIGVEGPEAALDAVRRVWASLWSDRALLYRRELGLEVESSAMAVVLQALVVGECSGVAFGAHPTEPGLAAIEAVYGLNQGLVDGSVEPDRWLLVRADGRLLEHVPPSSARRQLAAAGELPVEVPGPAGAEPPLDPAAVAEVATAVRRIEDLFGTPQDVEWTLRGRDLVILQARPITTAPAEGDRRSWYLSLTRSLDSLRRLRRQVEEELLPAMDREAAELAAVDPAALDDAALAGEIERRRAAHDRWVNVYWRDFIPLAHGMRLFGQFYNDLMRPLDPYEFMELLAASPMLSLRRNRALGALAARVAGDTELAARLAAGEPGDDAFESALAGFLREFGGAAFSDRLCFAERAPLVRLVLRFASSPLAPEVGHASAEAERAFFATVPPERRALAEELLDLGRASYRLRDDDNIHLARLEALVLEAAAEGRRRLAIPGRADASAAVDPERVAAALRDPNLVAEPPPATERQEAEPGFWPRPRQLVGQPAGPGLAVGSARIVSGVDDLFEIRPGEVLVCDAVDPNMTFVVPLVAAVVERRGGMLIHGAIIAREYGLPCVTGVAGATSLLVTGDRLTVDGHLGIVTVSGAAARS